MGDDFVVIYRGKAFPSLQPRPTLIVMPDSLDGRALVDGVKPAPTGLPLLLLAGFRRQPATPGFEQKRNP